MASNTHTYKVTIEDQVFKLTKSQIHFDSPNYFTFHLLDKSEDEVELTRDPHLFRIIVDYLNGYCVVPLRMDRLPPTMSPDIALANLRVDAEFYQLHGLLDMLDSPPPPLTLEYRKQRLFHHYLMIVHLGKVRNFAHCPNTANPDLTFGTFRENSRMSPLTTFTSCSLRSVNSMIGSALRISLPIAPTSINSRLPLKFEVLQTRS